MAEISVTPITFNVTIDETDFIVTFFGSDTNLDVTVGATINIGTIGGPVNLTDLANVDAVTPTDKDLLEFESSSGFWKNKPLSGRTIGELGDVVTTAPADNEVLAFDTASGKYTNQTPSEAGLSPTVHVHTNSQIVDFESGVSANVDVAANTANRHGHANQVELGLITDGDHDVRVDNPHSVDFDDLSAAEFIDFTPQVTPPARVEGRVWYDPDIQALTLYPDGTEVVHQLGHEILARVLNNTGSIITNGSVVKLDDNVGGLPTIILADALFNGGATAGMTTEDIGIGEQGLITVMGLVNEVDTLEWPVGTLLFLSETSGQVTDTIPDSPSYEVVIGQVVFQHETLGAIYVRIDDRGNEHGIDRFFNGAILEDFETTCTSDSSDVSFNIDKVGGGNLSIIFDEALIIFVAPVSVLLTAGTDIDPALNYVFIPQSTGLLTANTTGFPVAGHVPVGTVVVQSALSVQTDGVYKHHRWRDHMADVNDQGHLSHINAWVRSQHATWEAGGIPTLTIGSAPDPDDVFFSMTSGTARQMHINSFPSMDMGTGDPVFIVNDSVTPFLRVTNLNTVLVDSDGVSLSGRRFSLVFLAVINSDGTDTILCNLPSGSYGNDADAISDPDNFSDFSLPPDFRGAGILVARAVFRHQTIGSGTWTLVDLVDLRGNLIGVVSGGGGGADGGDDFSDAGFTIFNGTDSTRIMAFDVSGVATGTTKTMTIPNSDGTLLLEAFAQSLTNKTIDPLLNTIDGDVLDITFSPIFGYVPSTTPPEVTTVGQLTAHLYGIAFTLASRGDIFGPGSSVDNTIARYNGTSGASIKGSLVAIDNLGNITGVGTVDGRDIAVDGTKLDGIEALADVTDATNVEAASAIMDSDFSANGRMQRTGAGTYATVNPERSKTFTLLNPLDSDDISMFFMNRAITITEIHAARRGGTDIDFIIYHDTVVGGTTNVVCTVTTTTDGAGTDVTITDATIPQDSFLTYVQGTTDGTPTEITITIFYTED